MIALVWMVAAILSAPVWAGSVLLQQQQQPHSHLDRHRSTGNYPGEPHQLDDDAINLVELVNGTVHHQALTGDELASRDQQQQQQYLMNLCYSVSLIIFGFVWPLAALCWLYLRMYEAALKNSARTRRQSLCSNNTNNANASHPAEGLVGAAAVSAAATAAATASSNVEPIRHNSSGSGASTHNPSLPDALLVAGLANSADSQTSARLLAAAAAASNAGNHQRQRSNR